MRGSDLQVKLTQASVKNRLGGAGDQVRVRDDQEAEMGLVSRATLKASGQHLSSDWTAPLSSMAAAGTLLASQVPQTKLGN